MPSSETARPSQLEPSLSLLTMKKETASAVCQGHAGYAHNIAYAEIGGTGNGYRLAPVFALIFGTDHRDIARRMVVGRGGVVVAVCK